MSGSKLKMSTEMGNCSRVLWMLDRFLIDMLAGKAYDACRFLAQSELNAYTIIITQTAFLFYLYTFICNILNDLAHSFIINNVFSQPTQSHFQVIVTAGSAKSLLISLHSENKADYLFGLSY